MAICRGPRLGRHAPRRGWNDRLRIAARPTHHHCALLWRPKVLGRLGAPGGRRSSADSVQDNQRGKFGGGAHQYPNRRREISSSSVGRAHSSGKGRVTWGRELSPTATSRRHAVRAHTKSRSCRCDMDPTKVATLYSERLSLRLSAEAAGVLLENGKILSNDLIPHRTCCSDRPDK